MKQCKLTLPLMLVTVLISLPVFAEDDPIKGKALYATCAACHGQNGEGLQATNSPRLAGLLDWYLIEQLKNFRSGLRGDKAEDIFGAQMASMAKILPNDAALLDVVAYIGTLKATRSPRTENSGDPARGQNIYKGCMKCHGEKGEGYEAPEVIKFRSHYGPRLAGQHDWYLIRQIRHYKGGIRGTNRSDKATRYMLADFRSLQIDRDIFDLVAYIGTLE